MLRKFLAIGLLPLAGIMVGCAAGPEAQVVLSDAPQPALMYACYSYGCRRKAKIRLGGAETDRFAAIMAKGQGSAEAERAALSKAVQYYEDLSVKAIGARDLPKSPVAASGDAGQMDCIDESTNTHTVLRYLDNRGYLKFHNVRPNTSRGLLIDGRYPHWTAVVRDPAGTDWAVDSWYEAAGGPPDIVHLSYWRTRGVMGER